MSTLVRQRCWTHPLREAAARCPSCQRFFCRECVTEHEGRLTCASCLRAQLAAAAARRAARRRPWQVVAASWRAAQFTFCVVLAWFFFYLLGQSLLSLSDQFHDSNLWEEVNKLSGGGDS